MTTKDMIKFAKKIVFANVLYFVLKIVDLNIFLSVTLTHADI